MISRVPKATQEEMSAALDSCSRAFHSWSETSILARQQVFLRYQQLIKDNIVSQRVRKYKVQLKASFLFSAVRLCFIEVEQFDLFLQTSLLNLVTLVQNLPFAFDSKMLLQIILNLKIKTKDWHKGHLVFQKELAKAITVEQGKTLADAEGDVFRGLRKFIALTHVCMHTFTKGNK